MQKMYKTNGPASYTAGGFDFNATDFKKVTGAIPVADSGYKAEIASISGNTIKVKVLYYDFSKTAADVASEVPAAADLSGVTFYIVAEGL